MTNFIKLDRKEIVMEELSIDGKIVNADFLELATCGNNELWYSRGCSDWRDMERCMLKYAPEKANAYVLSFEKNQVKVRFYRVNLEYFIDGERIEAKK